MLLSMGGREPLLKYTLAKGAKSTLGLFHLGLPDNSDSDAQNAFVAVAFQSCGAST